MYSGERIFYANLVVFIEVYGSVRKPLLISLIATEEDLQLFYSQFDTNFINFIFRMDPYQLAGGTPVSGSGLSVPMQPFGTPTSSGNTPGQQALLAAAMRQQQQCERGLHDDITQYQISSTNGRRPTATADASCRRDDGTAEATTTTTTANATTDARSAAATGTYGVAHATTGECSTR